MNPVDTLRGIIFRQPAVEFYGRNGERLQDDAIVHQMEVGREYPVSQDVLEFGQKVERILDAENTTV